MSKRTVNVEPQARDISLLRDLFVSRVMTLAHVAALHFDGKDEAAKKRVQKLKGAGYVAERPRRAREPGILHLTKHGFIYLNAHGLLSEYPRLSTSAFEKRAKVSELTIRHEMAVMDAKAALVPEISNIPCMTVTEFCTWPLLNEFDVTPRRSETIRMKPDAYIRVKESTDEATHEHGFYLEVDRGSETLDTLTRKAECYREHYACGGYAMLHGGKRSEFADYPFRVLMVLPSEARRDNLAVKLLALNPPIETQMWLTTVVELENDPLGAIWVRPRECRTDAISRSERTKKAVTQSTSRVEKHILFS